MDALRTRTTLRLSAAAEWVVAALFLAATLAVTLMIVRELSPEPGVSAAPVAQQPNVPAAVPARAVSVPVLALADGTELRIGQSISAIAARLGRAAESGRQEMDRGLVGERLTRFYEVKGMEFILVFEPAEPLGEPVLLAIYLP